MGKGKKGEDGVCGLCRNFDPDKKGGYCRKREKKRSADDKACGKFDPR
jgi:hypothetical protein